jgi:hypothetical protein
MAGRAGAILAVADVGRCVDPDGYLVEIEQPA